MHVKFLKCDWCPDRANFEVATVANLCANCYCDAVALCERLGIKHIFQHSSDALEAYNDACKYYAATCNGRFVTDVRFRQAVQELCLGLPQRTDKFEKEEGI